MKNKHVRIMILGCMCMMATLTCTSQAADSASDDASDSSYDGGWTHGVNGGFGFGPWQLAVGSDGGHFVSSSSGNAGGGSGDIDTGGRAWGLWSTNGTTEAVRSFTGNLATGQVFRVAFDNGWITSGKSAGLALQNASGDNLWELYFSGGDAYYVLHNSAGTVATRIPFTGDGMMIEFELIGATTYLAEVKAAYGGEEKAWNFAGHLIAQGDQDVTRFRSWNFEAGPGANYDSFINSMSIGAGSLACEESYLTYPVVDTGQENCYNNLTTLTPPIPGAAFAGQDAQYAGRAPRYTMNGDGLTIYDNVTRLTWQQTADLDGDGDIKADDKLTWTQAQARPGALNAISYGGYNDWRLPSIKELYSLIDFRGEDPSGPVTDPTGLTAFINTNYFAFDYGDTGAGERIIDAQYASSNLYVADPGTLFGVNFADGRIKGYGLSLMGSEKTFWVLCVRGHSDYGVNQFVDNGDGTVTDLATGLTWQQGDNGEGVLWEEALTYAEGLELGGYNDWRLPNAKELQSVLDYSRSPDTSGSAALDPVFTCSSITNETPENDYPYFWTSTTHLKYTGDGDAGAYLCVGRGLGYDTIQGQWHDVHGAGCQRSDPKTGNPGDYPFGHGPQGDAIRIYNYVRCVRGGATAPSTDGDGDGLTDWYEYDYVTNSTAMAAGGDLDGDGFLNLDECRAGTSPLDPASYLGIVEVSEAGDAHLVSWQSVYGKEYKVSMSTNLLTDAFTETVAANIAGDPVMNVFTNPAPVTHAYAFYRVNVE